MEADYRPNVYASIFITLPLAALVLVLRLLAVVAFVRYA
jgi:hypothetical protein